MDSADIVKGLKEGKIKFREVETYTCGDSRKATDIRRKAVEENHDTDLSNVGNYTIDAAAAMQKNIENLIGCIQLPLGVAGPVKIKGDFAKGEFPIPLATTEGALVASVNRGCSIIGKSGGAKATVLKDFMTRAPVFRAKTAREALKFIEYVEQNRSKLKELCESTTKHGEFVEVKPYLVGRTVFLRFSFDTKDAMGMNMVTIAASKACEWLDGNHAEYIAASGNVCTDKKPNAMNIIEGRGKCVVAEVTIPKKVLEQHDMDAKKASETCLRKNWYGSGMAASYGFNAHFANIIAAFYLATGQDAAHVVEGSHGFTNAEQDGEDLYVSVTVPNIQVGTVGGGTRVATQKECLELLKCTGKGGAKKLSEIIACAVLAGEISLLFAHTKKELASAHQQLGR